jgi:hypothetical protein
LQAAIAVIPPTFRHPRRGFSQFAPLARSQPDCAIPFPDFIPLPFIPLPLSPKFAFIRETPVKKSIVSFSQFFESRIKT